MLGVEDRRQAAEPLLRSFLVVLASPGFDDGLRVGQTRKPVLVEAFITEPTVERFDVGVLIRFARFDQAQRDTAVVREAGDEAYSFSSIVLGIVNSTPFQMRMSAL